uniref:Iron-sulphur cluster assembly, putative n=1 Tax=Theileria annulata TaxID=5874 RepID=A0A3B0MFP6_THEAN
MFSFGSLKTHFSVFNYQLSLPLYLRSKIFVQYSGGYRAISTSFNHFRSINSPPFGVKRHFTTGFFPKLGIFDSNLAEKNQPQCVSLVFSIESKNHFSTSGEGRVTWEDHEEIASLLYTEFKSTNPLTVRFTDLHEMVEDVVRKHHFCEISGECSEGALEQIQMTWLELYEQD